MATRISTTTVRRTPSRLSQSLWTLALHADELDTALVSAMEGLANASGTTQQTKDLLPFLDYTYDVMMTVSKKCPAGAACLEFE